MIAVKPPPLRTVVVGKGRLGRAFASAPGLAESPPVVVAGRDGPARSDEILSAALQAGPEAVLLLAVRDDALEGLVATLMDTASALPRGTVALHHSGSHGAEILTRLEEAGLATGSCHPLQTFTGSRADAGRFQGITFAIDGSGAGLAAAERLALALGGHPVVVKASDRALYHLAASLGANGLTGLVAASRDALAGAGFAPSDALDALAPLLRSALEEALRSGPEASLTGPAARGDERTLDRHRRALLAWDASRAALLEALLREQRRLVSRGPGGSEC
ncbi:MAG: DUF2520 domain-containing protein [Deltaproteobacteria bacterium]|nr:DUF2520 domain-containing protein [Deltaproteobacteria bacterium]